MADLITCPLSTVLHPSGPVDLSDPLVRSSLNPAFDAAASDDDTKTNAAADSNKGQNTGRFCTTSMLPTKASGYAGPGPELGQELWHTVQVLQPCTLRQQLRCNSILVLFIS
jgi:hypothetical protein